jgi:hypothetical protein
VSSKEPFKITVSLYEDLHKYKDFFPNAIQMYFDHAIGMYACDYISDKPKMSVKLKVEYKPQYYKKLFELIEKEELRILNQNKGGDEQSKEVIKLNRTVLVNNIMSTLIGVKQYN